MPRKKYDLDEHATTLLKERYDSRSDTISYLSRALGVPRYTVTHWAQLLGLARTKEQPWSERDVAYLEAHFHRRHISTIAKKLKRTATAVSIKSKRLGIRKCGEGYTARSLGLALGVDVHKVTRWIHQGLLKASKRQTDWEYDAYLITDETVREFIVQHPLELDLRHVDGLWLIDLLANGKRKEVCQCQLPTIV